MKEQGRTVIRNVNSLIAVIHRLIQLRNGLRYLENHEPSLKQNQ